MKKLLLLALLVGSAQAATVNVPTPVPVGSMCMFKLGERVLINLGGITVIRYYAPNADVYSKWQGATVFFVSDKSVEAFPGNHLEAVENRIKECTK